MMYSAGAEPQLPGHGSHAPPYAHESAGSSLYPTTYYQDTNAIPPAPPPPAGFFAHLGASFGASFIGGGAGSTSYLPVELPRLPSAAGARPGLLSADTDLTPRPDPEEDAPPAGEPAMMMSHEEMQRRYGLGIRFYFELILFMVYSNALLVALSALNVVPHFTSIARQEGYRFALEDLFLSSYQGLVDYTAYKISWGILLPVTFAFGPLYYWWQARWFARNKHVPEVDLFARKDAIPENADVSHVSRACRIAVSYVVFGGLTVSVYFATDYFTRRQIALQADAGGRVSAAYGFSILISCFLIVLNLCWTKLCYLLTDFERLPTVSSVRRHNCCKLILFKILSLLVLTRAAAGAAIGAGQCVTEVLGRQYFTLILLELTVFNVIELLTPAFLRLLARCCPCLSPASKGLERAASIGGRRVALGSFADGPPAAGPGEDARPDFDVAAEYLELIYRQYLIYVGSGVFPLVSAVGLVTNFIEYFIDRYRLVRQCRPPVLRGSLKSLLLFSLTLAALAAALSPPRLIPDAATDGASFFWRQCAKVAR